MRRWILHVTAALSTLTAVCVTAAWIRSYSYMDMVDSYSPVTYRLYCAILFRGGLQIARSDETAGNDLGKGLQAFKLSNFIAAPPSDDYQILTGGRILSDRSFAGFRVVSGDLDPNQVGLSQPFWSLRIPLFAPLLVALVLPAWWLRMYLSNVRRAQANRCQACGYGLRGTPELCPECGRPVSEAAPAVT